MNEELKIVTQTYYYPFSVAFLNLIPVKNLNAVLVKHCIKLLGKGWGWDWKSVSN